MTDSSSGSVLLNWYQNRIGEPTTSDEVSGYWLFVAGVFLGIAGVVLFFVTEPRTTARGMSYALAALAPPFLMLGAVVRFPLRKPATYLGYAGLLASVAGIVWFLSIFPEGWSTLDGHTGVIGLYSLGIVAIGVAGAIIPLLTEPLLTDSQRAAADAAAAESAGRAADLAASRDQNARLESELAALNQSRGRFELFTDKSGKFRWRLRHRNGNVIADSGQGYTALHNAQKGLSSVRRNALGAGVLRIEPEVEDESPDDADDPVLAVPDASEEIESQATFEQFTDKGGEFRWRLRHDNGNIIADGGQGYNAKSSLTTAVDRIKQYVVAADYLWFDPAGFEVYRDAADEWRWRLVHRNGEIIADSGEGYSRRHDASRAVSRLQEKIDDLDFEVYEDSAGEYRWRVESANGNILADSGEGYDSKSGAEDAVERVKKHTPEADTLDIGFAAFEIFEDKGGEFRWRLRHRNGNIIADSGEGYDSRSGARDGIESVKRNAPGAAVEADE